MKREIPEKTRLAQLAVSDPEASAWVSANAGSGKTYVLAQRVIRLLLRGTPPARILCLTFTKAAAAHMANQVLRTLRSWTALDDTALDEALAKLDGAPPSPERRARARQLFATALETPGGLKVQTIHAFCDRVLHQFPFEAGVPAGFTVLEEVAEADLLRQAREDVLREATGKRDGALGKALSLAVSTVTDTTLAAVFDEVVRARRKLAYLLDKDGLARAEDAICGALGLNPRASVADIEAEILASPFLPRSEWKSIAGMLIALGGNPKARGEQLLEAALESDPHAIEAYLSVFVTGEGTIRKDTQFGAAKLREEEPAVQRLLAECSRLAPLVERRRAAQAFERSCALNLLGRAMIARYEDKKRARGALDYDDLVNRTVDLLENEAAAWVHYKLDGGIDHILIDEAQDTSPEQWKVIELLAAEFFAGLGASEKMRTVFAVGDEKQSIFSFQGADPKSFADMQAKFSEGAEAAKRSFQARRLELSFRSAEGIVQAVDAVFSTEAAYRGLSHRDGETRTIHEAIRRDAPALVEVWDTVRPPEGEEDELAWDAPLDAEAPSSGPAMLAQRIAKAVKTWLTKPDILVGDPETGEPRRPHEGDIIVLVRSRGPLFEAILRELKRADIAVAGADRLSLSEHIAVMDLAALCDALLLSSDDLALASALKSPLFGFTEEELFEIAHGRDGTLASALEKAAAGNPKFAEAASQLARWRAEARALRPFDFLSRVLSRDRGRERFLARLGPEASDALDELMAHALAYEASETPSLAGFLVFLRRGGSQVKRDLEVESRAVRVMTVHGVKGLEAPIIVLADTTSAPDSKRHHPRLMTLEHGGESLLVWAAGEDSAAIARARELVTRANEEEHRRLLYVALTRARDALIVCGLEGKRGERAEDCWYSLVRSALEKNAEDWREVENHGYGFPEKVYRWRHRPAEARAEPPFPTAPEIAEPAWLRVPLEAPGKGGVPSGARMPPAPQPGLAPRMEARRRGILIHRLLQELPRYAADDRAAAAKRYLDRAAADLPAGAHEAIADEVLAVLGRAELSVLFGPESRAEVSILGRWQERSGLYTELGRVDRLAVTAAEVWIADFKSDAVPPSDAGDVPESYILQLARYRAALAKLYPDKAMRALVIWTANGAIHHIPNAVLDKAFFAFTAA